MTQESERAGLKENNESCSTSPDNEEEKENVGKNHDQLYLSIYLSIYTHMQKKRQTDQ